MENEEKEDLLLEVTESEEELYEKEEIDDYIEKKILNFVQNETPNLQPKKKTMVLIATCLFTFFSSSVLIIALPIYLSYSSASSISTYTKLVTLSLVNVILLVIAHLVRALSKCGSHHSGNHNLSFGDVLKVSFLLSLGSVSVLWLTDGNYVSCHLKDPLKGCCIGFSLLFYFLFSRKKMSLERTFCAITIIVGVFVSVDFGICDKFQCNGNSNVTEITPKFHFLYVVLYLLAHGVWVLNFTLIEIGWTTNKNSESNLNVSILSNVSSTINPGIDNTKPSIQSLSIICQEEEENTLKNDNSDKSKPSKRSFFNLRGQNTKILISGESDNSLNNSVPCRNLFSVPDFRKFPMTSTPNHETEGWQSWVSGRCYDVALWQHIICCLLVLGLCWMPTMSFLQNEKGKILADVVSDILESFTCHVGWSSNSNCSYLPAVTILVSVSHVVLILSSIELLKITHSAITVVSILMPALPVAGLFWSLFQISRDSSALELDPEITGEAVCAVLGLPIIGIGIVLLIKSHIREFHMVI